MCVYIHITVEARRGASDPSELELLVFVSWDPSSGPQNKQQVLLSANPSLHTNTPRLHHSVSTLYKRILWRGTIRIASLSRDWHCVKLIHLLICDVTFWNRIFHWPGTSLSLPLHYETTQTTATTFGFVCLMALRFLCMWVFFMCVSAWSLLRSDKVRPRDL